jgi:hypothetical protein
MLSFVLLLISHGGEQRLTVTVQKVSERLELSKSEPQLVANP